MCYVICSHLLKTVSDYHGFGVLHTLRVLLTPSVGTTYIQSICMNTYIYRERCIYQVYIHNMHIYKQLARPAHTKMSIAHGSRWILDTSRIRGIFGKGLSAETNASEGTEPKQLYLCI